MDESDPQASLGTLLAHRAWVRAVARAIFPDRASADDLEQRTWVAAMTRPPRAGGSLRAWLGTVLRNTAAKMRTTEARRRAREEANARADGARTAEDTVATAEAHGRVVRAVLALSPPLKAAILLRYFEDLKPREIAARLDVPVETVYTRLKRGLRQLRETLAAERDERGRRGRRGLAALLPLLPAGPGGVAVMGTKVKVAVAAGLMLLGGAVAWRSIEGNGDGGPAPAGRPPEVAALPDPAPEPEPVAEPAEAEEGAFVTGRVVDDVTGEPVAGARVTLGSEFVRRPDSEPSALTEPDGTVRIPRPEDYHFADAFVAAEGYARLTAGVRDRDDLGELRLVRGAVVRGRVVSAGERRPVAGAAILLSAQSHERLQFLPAYAVPMGRSGPGGAFALERVPPSHRFPWTLIAITNDAVGTAALPGTTGRENIGDVEVEMLPAGAATVIVRAPEGTPVEGARVVAFPRFEPLGTRDPQTEYLSIWIGHREEVAGIFSGRTGGAGSADLAKLPVPATGGGYVFVARKAGFPLAVSKPRGLRPGHRIEVTLDLAVLETRALTGIVRSPDGSPVTGAVVLPWGQESMAVKTDEAGRYRVDGLSAAADRFWFRVRADGYAQAEEQAPLRGPETTKDVALERAAPVEGRVVDQDGNPVAGVYLDLSRYEAHRQLSLETGPDGRFAFPDATDGEWDFRVLSPKPRDEWAKGDYMTTVRGGERDVRIVLNRLPPGRTTIRAEVVDAATGESLAPRESMLLAVEQPEPRPQASYRAAEHGTAGVVLRGVHRGRYRLWVQVPDRPAACVEVSASGAEEEVRARVEVGRLGAIAGRVEFGDEPRPGPLAVFASLVDVGSAPQYHGVPGGTTGFARVGDDGTFRIEGLMPARYRVRFTSGTWLGEALATVPSGGDGRVVVRAAQAAAIEFRSETPSPSDTVVFEIAKDGGPFETVMRYGGYRGKPFEYRHTLRPGAVRWRVSFPAANVAGSLREAVPAIEGALTAVAGRTHEVVVGR